MDCNPASGSTFALGDTPVQCSATAWINTAKVYKLATLANGPITEVTARDAATSGYNFRYTTDGIWKYNLASKTIGQGEFLVRVDLNDGETNPDKVIITTDSSPG